jgi:hypothetical protein
MSAAARKYSRARPMGEVWNRGRLEACTDINQVLVGC